MVAWAAGAVAVLATVGLAALAWLRPPAREQPAPSLPPLALPDKVDPADWIRPLSPIGKHAPGHGLFSVDYDQPMKAISLRLGEGPVLYADAAPKLGGSVKFDIVPHDYVVHFEYPNGFTENVQLNVYPGSEDRWHTHRYRDSAPVEDDPEPIPASWPADAPVPAN